jgi:hypothetical protein
MGMGDAGGRGDCGVRTASARRRATALRERKKEGGFRGTQLVAQESRLVPGSGPRSGRPPSPNLAAWWGFVCGGGGVVVSMCCALGEGTSVRVRVREAFACRGNGRVRWRTRGSPPLDAGTHTSPGFCLIFFPFIIFCFLSPGFVSLQHNLPPFSHTMVLFYLFNLFFLSLSSQRTKGPKGRRWQMKNMK